MCYLNEDLTLPLFTSHPPDVIHPFSDLPPVLTTLLILCIVNANQSVKCEKGLGPRLEERIGRLRMRSEMGHARCATQTVREREAMLQHKSTSECERRQLNGTSDAS